MLKVAYINNQATKVKQPKPTKRDLVRKYLRMIDESLTNKKATVEGSLRK